MQQDLLAEYHERDALLARSNGSILSSLITCNHFDAAQELMAEGFGFREHDKSFFLLAALQDNVPALSFFLTAGFDVDETNGGGQTPLHLCNAGATARALIRAGADVNARDRDGNTPLHLARQKDKAEVLIENGAECLVKNDQGHTPERFLWFWAKTQRGGDGYEVVADATRLWENHDELRSTVQAQMADRPTQKRRAL